jgi:phosphoglycolate phosphatase
MNKLNIIFDLDGTLVDSYPGIESSLSAALNGNLRPHNLPDLRPMLGPPINEILRRIIPDLNETDIHMIEERFRSIYDAEGWKFTCPYPGVIKSLKTLKVGGASLFVVTNKPFRPTSAILQELGLAPLLITWVCRDSRRPPFPTKREVLLDLMENLKMDPAHTLYVGDMPEDKVVAQTCGILFIGAAYGYGDLSDLKQSEYIRIDRFEDLIPALDKLIEVI